MRYDSEYIKYFMQEIQELPQDAISKKAPAYQNFQESERPSWTGNPVAMGILCYQTIGNKEWKNRGGIRY
jgi:hypothetical protein